MLNAAGTRWKQHYRQVKTNRPSRENLYSPRLTLGPDGAGGPGSPTKRDQLSHSLPVLMLLPERSSIAPPTRPLPPLAVHFLQGLFLCIQRNMGSPYLLSSDIGMQRNISTLLSSASPNANPEGLLPTSPPCPPPLQGLWPPGLIICPSQTHTLPLLWSSAE